MKITIHVLFCVDGKGVSNYFPHTKIESLLDWIFKILNDTNLGRTEHLRLPLKLSFQKVGTEYTN